MYCIVNEQTRSYQSSITCYNVVCGPSGLHAELLSPGLEGVTSFCIRAVHVDTCLIPVPRLVGQEWTEPYSVSSIVIKIKVVKNVTRMSESQTARQTDSQEGSHPARQSDSQTGSQIVAVSYTHLTLPTKA